MEDCTLTVKDHVDAILYGSASLGAGMGCQNAYFAVLELAAAMEAVHGYKRDGFVPSGIMDDLIARSLQARQEEIDALVAETAQSPRS